MLDDFASFLSDFDLEKNERGFCEKCGCPTLDFCFPVAGNCRLFVFDDDMYMFFLDDNFSFESSDPDYLKGILKALEA